MYKQIGSIMLVAGTCIGSGMIALPMVLAKLGLVYSIILMILTWLLAYYTSLVNLELNLHAGHGMSLGALGKRFSGHIAEGIGFTSLKVLSYSLLAVYIYGISSITQKLINTQIDLRTISTCYCVCIIFVMLIPLKLLDHLNKFLFAALVLVIGILIMILVNIIHWQDLPLFPLQDSDISMWKTAIPVVFTSFGFQVIFHTLTNYCNKDSKMLKLTFFWGSLIPALLYIVWSSSAMSVIYYHNSSFYISMMNGSVEVGDLVEQLSSLTKIHYIQLLVWWISLLAIITSILGVGVGLCESLEVMLIKYIPNNKILRRFAAATITVLPSYMASILVPNAFISVLSFAGMILVVIAILLPVYLLYVAKINKFYYNILKIRSLMILSILAGLFIIFCEITNIFF